MTFLFGIISLVAVFLIFCIFYMIVVEKTKDIGIIKSVGATAGGVAGIFLGYGLAIGIVGASLGLLRELPDRQQHQLDPLEARRGPGDPDLEPRGVPVRPDPQRDEPARGARHRGVCGAGVGARRGRAGRRGRRR